MLGRKGRCPDCQSTFVIEDDAAYDSTLPSLPSLQGPSVYAQQLPTGATQHTSNPNSAKDKEDGPLSTKASIAIIATVSVLAIIGFGIVTVTAVRSMIGRSSSVADEPAAPGLQDLPEALAGKPFVVETPTSVLRKPRERFGLFEPYPLAKGLSKGGAGWSPLPSFKRSPLVKTPLIGWPLAINRGIIVNKLPPRILLIDLRSSGLGAETQRLPYPSPANGPSG
jgi:hypothetical protein